MTETARLRQLTYDQMNRVFAGMQEVICYARLARQPISYRKEALPEVQYEGMVTLSLDWGERYVPGRRRRKRNQGSVASREPLCINVVNVTVPSWRESGREWVEYMAPDITTDGTMFLESKHGHWLMELYRQDGEGAVLENYEVRRERMVSELLMAVQQQWIGTGISALQFLGEMGTTIIPIPQVAFICLNIVPALTELGALADLLEEVSRRYALCMEKKEQPLGRSIALCQATRDDVTDAIELIVEVHPDLADLLIDELRNLPGAEVSRWVR